MKLQNKIPMKIVQPQRKNKINLQKTTSNISINTLKTVTLEDYLNLTDQIFSSSPELAEFIKIQAVEAQKPNYKGRYHLL